VVGKSVRLVVVGAYHDAAGNRAVADETVFDVKSAGPVATRVDFDTLVNPPLYGAAEYHGPSEANPLCESGGCVFIDSMNFTCDTKAELPVDGALAVRIDVLSGRYRYRYRVLSTNDGGVRLDTEEGADGSAPTYAMLSKLPNVVEGAFLYASDWKTAVSGPPFGPSADQGLLFLPPCGSKPARSRVVIEWIEALGADGGS
jgi:hypothetical protein